MRLTFRLGDASREVEVTSLGGGRYAVTIDGQRLELAAEIGADGALRLAAPDGPVQTAFVSRDGPRRFVTVRGAGDAVLERVEPAARRAARHDRSGDLAAPMPGKVVALRVAEGDSVARGQLVAVVEAMKMEMPIVAPRAGRVARVRVAVGAPCEAGEALIDLVEEDAVNAVDGTP